MEKLYHCKSCGFISTLKSEFSYYNNICFCVDCLSKHQCDEYPEYEWVENAIKKYSFE